MNNHELAHAWANQSKPRGTGSNFFFEGPELYSYGKHFMVARILPSGAVVMSTRGYSSTTQRHQSLARNAVTHMRRVYCRDAADSAATNARAARDAIVSELAAMQKPRIRQTTKDALAAKALHLANQFNEYLQAIGAEGVGTEPIDVSNLQGLAEQAARAEAAQAAMAAERAKAREAQILQTLSDWRAGVVRESSGLWNLPTALRLGASRGTYRTGGLLPDLGSGGHTVVQTSRGAEIPVADAHKLWPIILRVRNGDRDYTPGEPLGQYRLTKINRDGSIVVGCHDIAFDEIKDIAFQLGYITEGL